MCAPESCPEKIASRLCLRSYDHDHSQKSVAMMTSFYGHSGMQFKKRTIRSLHYVGQYVVIQNLRKLALRSLIGQIKWRALLLHIFVLFLKSLLKKYPAPARNDITLQKLMVTKPGEKVGCCISIHNFITPPNSYIGSNRSLHVFP